MSTSFWLTQVIYMTVCANDSFKTQSNPSLPGTGLSDGYPPGGVDAHDVCSIYADAHLETDILHLSFHSQTSSLSTFPTIS